MKVKTLPCLALPCQASPNREYESPQKIKGELNLLFFE